MLKSIKALWDWGLSHYRDPDHEQRKQFATTCNTVAAIVTVNCFFNGKGIMAFMMLLIAVALWLVSIAVVRKQDKE